MVVDVTPNDQIQLAAKPIGCNAKLGAEDHGCAALSNLDAA